MRCPKCGQERPDGVDTMSERAWDLLHQGCSAIYTWQEFKAAANEYYRSGGDMVRAAIAAAYASQHS